MVLDDGCTLQLPKSPGDAEEADPVVERPAELTPPPLPAVLLRCPDSDGKCDEVSPGWGEGWDSDGLIAILHLIFRVGAGRYRVTLSFTSVSDQSTMFFIRK